ncbi:hypothetical protein VV869_04625 [Photobacterium sp. MCCC 1A19761]|uniref:hypothetical protein n=1 Tax=Photobacterium sp. MCCC 1A19761 TaxID=3115000 RepID=UPI00307E62AF
MGRLVRDCGGLLLVILLVGCAETRHERLVELGFTRNYLDGYQDGCSSRKLAAKTYLDGFRQDPERLAADPKYAHGWQDGFEQCYADNTSYF